MVICNNCSSVRLRRGMPFCVAIGLFYAVAWTMPKSLVHPLTMAASRSQLRKTQAVVGPPSPAEGVSLSHDHIGTITAIVADEQSENVDDNNVGASANQQKQVAAQAEEPTRHMDHSILSGFDPSLFNLNAAAKITKKLTLKSDMIFTFFGRKKIVEPDQYTLDALVFTIQDYYTKLLFDDFHLKNDNDASNDNEKRSLHSLSITIDDFTWTPASPGTSASLALKLNNAIKVPLEFGDMTAEGFAEKMATKANYRQFIKRFVWPCCDEHFTGIHAISFDGVGITAPTAV